MRLRRMGRESTTDVIGPEQSAAWDGLPSVAGPGAVIQADRAADLASAVSRVQVA